MEILAIIPARSGSKRIPNKNKKLLGGIPLISWTINAALKSEVFSEVFVSTDSEAIAEIARKWGLNVPSLRPTYLSTDNALSNDVISYSIDLFKNLGREFEAIVLLQPTSPFRTVQTIKRGVKLFSHFCGKRSVISMHLAKENPFWMFRLKNDKMLPILGWESFKKRSQDFESFYTLNGAFFMSKVESFMKRKSFFSPDFLPLELTEFPEVLDIDSFDDWDIAEKIIRENTFLNSF